MKVKRISNWTEAENYKLEWIRLLSKFEQPRPSMTYDWLRLWWQYFGDGKELCLLVIEDDSGLKAVAPFMVYCGNSFLGFPARIVQLIGNSHSIRVDFLTSQERRRAAIDAIVSCLTEIEWDVLYIFLIPEESPNLRHFLISSVEMGYKIGIQPSWLSPYLTIKTDWQSYLNSKRHQFRSLLRRRIRSLSQLGTLQFDTFCQVDNVDSLKERIFNVASKGWAAKQGTAISSTPQLQGFYTNLTEIANQKGWLFCHILSLNDAPIAFEYNLRFNKKIFNLKLGFDEEFSKFSPGAVLKSFALKEAFAQGFKEYDFLGEDERYKMQWANGIRRHFEVYIFNHRVYSKCFHWLPFAAKERIKKVKPLRRFFNISNKYDDWNISVKKILQN